MGSTDGIGVGTLHGDACRNRINFAEFFFGVSVNALTLRVGRGPISDFSTFSHSMVKRSGGIFYNQNRYCPQIHFYAFLDIWQEKLLKIT